MVEAEEVVVEMTDWEEDYRVAFAERDTANWNYNYYSYDGDEGEAVVVEADEDEMGNEMMDVDKKKLA